MKKFGICSLVIGVLFGFGIWSLGFAPQAEAVEHKWEVGQGTGLTTTEFVVKDARIGVGAIRLAIDANGNVGIGTTSPIQKLEIAGNAKITGNLTALNILTDTHRQDITVDSVVSNQVVRKGWTYIQGNNTVVISKTIYYGITFEGEPIVVAMPLGYTTGVPDNINDFDHSIGMSGAHLEIICITTTSFSLNMRGADSFGPTAYMGFSWIAIGTKK